MDKPTIFISYSRTDITFVRRLAGDLTQAGYNP
ncbi:MAG: toll/interleukin-1 receptor domain-containing protein [Caldilineaceae bacterium]|nr:toll/interleukin-1 receptor domain-containing protein [Caldilineaceae bacterium]MCB0126503.1 toll/interleukin-1 receptor domain-containing protein [Caldilineaceae bacterium]